MTDYEYETYVSCHRYMVEYDYGQYESQQGSVYAKKSATTAAKNNDCGWVIPAVKFAAEFVLGMLI